MLFRSGVSYYFRGNVTNNYVQFGVHPQDIWYKSGAFSDGVTYKYYYETEASCGAGCSKIVIGSPMIFRIVRINGDGTIRIALEPSITEMAYNTSYNNEKYVGYTYDKDTTEQNSSIKTYLDTWYDKVKTKNSGIDNVLANGKFCNDTSSPNYNNGDANKFYGPWERILPNSWKTSWGNDMDVTNIKPSLKCPANQNPNYGGVYKLKVGMLSMDELAFAGIKYFIDDTKELNEKFYLFNGEYNWTISPAAFNGAIAHAGGGISFLGINYVDFFIGVRPVFNLNANILITEGNGTIDIPYKIKIK